MMIKEFYGNIWDFPCDLLAITTNGYIKQNGAGVMGRGIARQARDSFDGIDQKLGDVLRERGNHMGYLMHDGLREIWSFPVKHHWRDKADIELIKRSAYELKSILKMRSYTSAMVRPGCGNGQLSWSDVKPVLDRIFDDVDVYVVEFP